MVKLIDFGYSNSFGDASHASMRTLCGSPYYLPPEIILGRSYGPKVCREEERHSTSRFNSIRLTSGVWDAFSFRR